MLAGIVRYITVDPVVRRAPRPSLLFAGRALLRGRWYGGGMFFVCLFVVIFRDFFLNFFFLPHSRYRPDGH